MEYRGRIDGDEILQSKWLEARIRKETEDTAMRARANAAVDSGRLKRSIRTDIQRHGGVKRDRVVGRVIASAVRESGNSRYDYSPAREFGTSDQRGDYFLRRSLPL